MEPEQTIKYLVLVINSIRMTLSLTEVKLKGIFPGMQNNIFNKIDNGFAVNTINRSSIIHHTSSSSSSDSVFLSTASRSVSPEKRNVLQRENYSKRSGTGRIAMVDRKPKILLWKASDSRQASDSNTGRCITGRLESQLHEYGDWGEMVSRREEIPHKYPRTPSGEGCHLSFYKRVNNKCNSYSDLQHNWEV